MYPKAAARPGTASWKRETGVLLVRAGAIVTLAAVALSLFVGILEAVSVNAAAGAYAGFSPLWNVAPVLLGIGLIGLVVGGVLMYFDFSGTEKVAPVLAAGATVLVILAVSGFALQWLDNSALLGGGGGPEPPPGFVANWLCIFEILAAGGPGGAHDASTEFPTGNGFIAADGGTPDYDSTIATPVYDGSRAARIDITVDDEANMQSGVGANGNTWFNEDTYAFDVHCTLQNPPNAVGGGFATVPIYGRISVPYLFGQKGNATDNPVFVCDATNGGMYLGFGKVVDGGSTGTAHDANHDYISYLTSRTCTGMPTVGDWIPLGGSSTTSPQNGEWISTFFVLDSGAIAYEDTTTSYTIHAEFGIPPENTAWRGNTQSVDILLVLTDD